MMIIIIITIIAIIEFLIKAYDYGEIIFLNQLKNALSNQFSINRADSLSTETKNTAIS